VTDGAAAAPQWLRWLGHSTVLLELGGVRVLTDPLLRPRLAHLRRIAPLDPAAAADVDAVLVSHVHYDHLDLPSLARLGRGTPVVVPRGAGRMLLRRGFREVVETEAGEVVDVRGLRVLATHAEHLATRLPGGPRVASLGYVIEGPKRVYFAGDTDMFEEMALVGELAVALVPIAGWGPRLPPGHLDPERAARALRLLRPRIAIPIHWGTYRSVFDRSPDTAPAAEFVRHAAELAPDVDVQVLQVGERLEL
jgi:L-ascorbate metabolism protein UlaG (beta-lactamase superfamily)